MVQLSRLITSNDRITALQPKPGGGGTYALIEWVSVLRLVGIPRTDSQWCSYWRRESPGSLGTEGSTARSHSVERQRHGSTISQPKEWMLRVAATSLLFQRNSRLGKGHWMFSKVNTCYSSLPQYWIVLSRYRRIHWLAREISSQDRAAFAAQCNIGHRRRCHDSTPDRIAEKTEGSRGHVWVVNSSFSRTSRCSEQMLARSMNGRRQPPRNPSSPRLGPKVRSAIGLAPVPLSSSRDLERKRRGSRRKGTPRKCVLDVTSIGPRSSPCLCNSVKVEIKCHLECKLHFSSAQLMLGQMHLTNVSESIEAKHRVSWLSFDTSYENRPWIRHFVQ